MVKSIFELERRFDFDKEFNRLIELLNKKIYPCNNYYQISFWYIVNLYFTEWKYRLSALNVEQYFEDIGIDFNNLKYCNSEQKIYVLQFVDSYIMFLINNYKINEYINLNDVIYKPYLTIIKNIGIILERLNFERDINEEKQYITYIKRDADVDSVLSIIKNEDDLRLALLEYNDFRIENDKEAKKQIILRIGNYIELNKAVYKEKNNTLFKNISDILNNFNIRHSNENQIILRDVDIIPVYDTCFKMMIHLIRDSYIKDSYRALIDIYRIKDR